MAARTLALLALAASCTFNHGSLGGDADTKGSDGDTSDVPAADTDGDGVADAVDNCAAITNADQANEDGDDRGNACDACPHRMGTLTGGDGDDDGDGIGNQCDPRVGTDRRVVFLGFDAASERSAFALRAGSDQWSVAGGQLHQTDATFGVPQNIVWTGESINGPILVESHVHIDSLPAGVGTRLAAVVGGYYDGATVDLYACGLRGADAGSAATVAAWHFVAPPTINLLLTAATTGTISAGKHAYLRLIATLSSPSSSALDCLADASPVMLAIAGYVPDGYPGFRVLSALASFDYFFVVAIGS